jgi:ATP-dependent helicase/nuclease subunit B
VPAEEIVVVYRDLDGVAGIVRSVFGEFGIPVRVVKRPCLGESAVCGFLLDVLEAVDGWDRETVVDVLTSAWFRPADERDRLFLDAIPSLARLAQIVAGYREWTERLNALVGRLNEAGEEEAGHDDPDRADPDLFARYVRHMPDAPQAAQALLDRVDRLASIAVGLPSRAGMCQHLLALERLIEACGIPEAIVRHPVPEVRAAEASALATLRALLAQIYAWCETQPEVVTISRSELLLRLRKAFDETPYEPGDPRDAVACLDAEAVRGLRFDYVFFCGVNEGQIPKAPPSNAVYSDEDLEELERLDIHLDGRQGRSDPELLLFHRVLDVPRRHLTITYRTLAPDGKALRPSPFLEDLIDLFPADAGVLRPPIAASAFVPAPEHAASWRDLRNAAFDGATGLRRVFAEELWRVERGCLLEERRHDSTPLDVFDGVIADEALRARLTERFGEGHIYSVSQIEAYVRCPFAYYAVRVLGVLDIEPPSEEFDTRLMGTLLHDVLQAFHHHYRRRSICDLEETEAATAMSDFLELVFARAMRQALNVPSGVAAVIRRQVETILARYLRHCRKDEERRWEPAHFEVTFGEYRKTFEDPLDRPDPLCLTTSQGKVLFKGRIDRIDIAGDGCARIIDYKSSTPPTKGSMEDGVSLQLPLYALAVAEHLLPDLNCEGAYFLHLGRDKWVEGMDRTSKKDGWPDRRATALGAVARAVQGIRIGNFPPQPQANACRFCPAAPACRYEPARIERKRSEKADEADN